MLLLDTNWNQSFLETEDPSDCVLLRESFRILGAFSRIRQNDKLWFRDTVTRRPNLQSKKYHWGGVLRGKPTPQLSWRGFRRYRASPRYSLAQVVARLLCLCFGPSEMSYSCWRQGACSLCWKRTFHFPLFYISPWLPMPCFWNL